jgi:prolycopene isomerase
MALTCYNAVWPEISPPGTSVLVLTAPMMGKPWYNVPPEEYVNTKNRIADAMLRMAEQVVPGLRDHVEELEVSTPLTNMRYAGTLGGSIYGFAQPAHDHTVLRIPHRGPVGGLYFVGAWTQPGGGFEPAMMSGEMAGERVLKEWNKGRKGGSHGA